MKRLASLALTGLLLSTAIHAEVKPAKPFTDHMVLQRDMAVPIFGTADPQEAVTVTFCGQTKKATADANGRWRVALDPLEAGGPHAMTIAGANTVTLEDILVGEVWVGSGQSNMAGGAGRYANGDEVLAKWIKEGPYPKLRLLLNRGQGESGTMFPEIDQFTMMGVLIGGWRELWGQGDFPWIYVQKPSGGGCAWGLENDPTTRMADAVIDGKTVVVSCADVPSPLAVRYAWARSAPWANLFNKDGLPAPAFRTDSW